MADKEATVFILDLGSSMGQAHNGREESDLDWSMRFVWDKITDAVASNRKTLNVGVIGLKTDETNNKLDSTEGYENISVLQGLQPMTMTDLRQLQASIVPSQTRFGDAISSIVIAVDMIETKTKKLKYIRKIYLVTDGQGSMDVDDIEDIGKKMNASGIELTVLGVDFDDPEYGFKEEDKPPHKKQNELALRKLTEACDNGTFGTMADAIDRLDTPTVKTPKPYKTYDGKLTLGDPNAFPAAINIDVERYFKTHLARPLGASTVVTKQDQPGSQTTETVDGNDMMDGVEFTGVKQARTYKVNDPDAPGGKRDVEFESLAKGFEYGRTAVHITESEHNITKLETQKCFTILGFIPWDRYEAFLNMGEVCVTHAKKYDEASEVALSALIWALHEVQSYAVARLVIKEGKEPLLVLLIPHIEPGFECLYDVPLPFAEDVRSYQFPPLDRVITVSGQTLSKHRFIPSDELNDAMGAYVDAMDLSNYGIDEDGAPAEYMPIDDSYNPSIHRINHAVRNRAVHPEDPVPDIPPQLLRFAEPPHELVERVQSKIDTLIGAAEIKKVPPKAKGKRRRDAVKPISGLDVDALLGNTRQGQISPENAVPDFKHALETADSEESLEGASKQMGAIIRSLITDSFGDSKYNRAIECCGVMREELINMDEPNLFNNFVIDLKKQLLSGALGGDRRDFWFKLRWAQLGLIDSSQSESSDLTTDAANEFYKAK